MSPLVTIFSGLFHSNKLIYHKNVPLLSLSDHNKVGHDQLLWKIQYTKYLVQDRHFLPKCNAWSKMPILLSEGKIKSFDFENTKLNVLSQAELAVFILFYKGIYFLQFFAVKIHICLTEFTKKSMYFEKKHRFWRFL